jgi:hypothetical protein
VVEQSSPPFHPLPSPPTTTHHPRSDFKIANTIRTCDAILNLRSGWYGAAIGTAGLTSGWIVPTPFSTTRSS